MSRPIASLVIESTRRGFPSVARCLREWGQEPRSEVADALEAFAVAHDLGALREPPGEAQDRHRATATELRRIASELLA